MRTINVILKRLSDAYSSHSYENLWKIGRGGSGLKRVKDLLFIVAQEPFLVTSSMACYLSQAECVFTKPVL